jgi:hypothetical protein
MAHQAGQAFAATADPVVIGELGVDAAPHSCVATRGGCA